MFFEKLGARTVEVIVPRQDSVQIVPSAHHIAKHHAAGLQRGLDRGHHLRGLPRAVLGGILRHQPAQIAIGRVLILEAEADSSAMVDDGLDGHSEHRPD